MPSWPSLHLDGARDRPRLRLRARKWVLLLLLHEEGRKEGVWREKDSLAAAPACRRAAALHSRGERERESGRQRRGVICESPPGGRGRGREAEVESRRERAREREREGSGRLKEGKCRRVFLR